VKQKTKLNKCERNAKKLLELEYDKVYKIGHDGNSLHKLANELKIGDLDFFSNQVSYGEPDFLAFNNASDYKFVEVKSKTDTFTKRQFEWLSEFGHRENIEVWYFDESKTKVDLKLTQEFILNRIPKELMEAMNWDKTHQYGFNVTSSNSIEIYSKTKEQADT